VLVVEEVDCEHFKERKA